MAFDGPAWLSVLFAKMPSVEALRIQKQCDNLKTEDSCMVRDVISPQQVRSFG